MGVYAHFFIEYKEKDTNEWKALRAYFPFKEQITTYYDEKGNKIEKVTEPNVLTTDGEALDKFDYLVYQGHIRDLISNSFDKCHFADRGLPSDISDEVKTYFDKELEKIQKENEEYKTKYGVEKTWGNTKWWWSETYFSLAELEEQLEKEQKEWEERLTKAFEKKYKDIPLMAKMNEVLAVVKGKEYKKKKNEDEEYIDEDIDYYLHDEIYDLFQLNAFIITVSEFIDNLTYDTNNIRLIAWCS